MKRCLLLLSGLLLVVPVLAQDKKPEKKPEKVKAPKVLKEFAAFRKILDDGMAKVIKGDDPSDSFSKFEYRGDSDYAIKAMEKLRADLKAFKIKRAELMAFELRFYFTKNGTRTAYVKGVVMFTKEGAVFAPFGGSLYHDRKLGPGDMSQDVAKDKYPFLGDAPWAMVKACRKVDRWKEGPIVSTRKMVRALMLKKMDEERFDKEWQKYQERASKAWDCMKSAEFDAVQIDLDDAVFKAYDDKGKYVGYIGGDFNVNKDKISWKLKSFRENK